MHWDWKCLSGVISFYFSVWHHLMWVCRFMASNVKWHWLPVTVLFLGADHFGRMAGDWGSVCWTEEEDWGSVCWTEEDLGSVCWTEEDWGCWTEDWCSTCWTEEDFPEPMEQRGLVADYALEGGEIRSGLTKRILCVLGQSNESVPWVLVAVAEGTEVATYLLDLPLHLTVTLRVVSRR